MKPLEVAIAGCGTAGLAAALLLHRQGHSVTLFDRFERPQPIGSGLMLQPTGMAVLDYLELGEKVRAMGAPIRRLFGRSTTTGRPVLDVHYAWLKANGQAAIGIHRATLFTILFDAVCAHGIKVRQAHEVIGSQVTPAKRSLVFSNGSESREADLVIDASGVGSRLAAPGGRTLAYGALWGTIEWPTHGDFDEAALEQRYRAASLMIGIMPIGRITPDGKSLGTFFWSLRQDQLDTWRETPLNAWKDQVLAAWPDLTAILPQFTDHSQLTFAQYAHRTLASPAAERLIHVGDAWHSTSPQLGQGANMALLDVYALAMGLADEADLNRALRRAVRLRRWHVRLYQAFSGTLTPFYQSDSRVLPWIRDALVPHVARRWPATSIQARMVSGLIGNPLGCLGLGHART